MKITRIEASELGKKFKINYKSTPFSEWYFGLNVETEHSDIANNSKIILAKIVIAHLKENPRYYAYLKEMEKLFK